MAKRLKRRCIRLKFPIQNLQPSTRNRRVNYRIRNSYSYTRDVSSSLRRIKMAVRHQRRHRGKLDRRVQGLKKKSEFKKKKKKFSRVDFSFKLSSDICQDFFFFSRAPSLTRNAISPYIYTDWTRRCQNFLSLSSAFILSHLRNSKRLKSITVRSQRDKTQTASDYREPSVCGTYLHYK